MKRLEAESGSLITSSVDNDSKLLAKLGIHVYRGTLTDLKTSLHPAGSLVLKRAGYPAIMVRNNPDLLAKAIHPEDFDDMRAKNALLLRQGGSVSRRLRVKTAKMDALALPSGFIVFEDSLTIERRGRQRIGVFGVLKDITEQVIYEDKLIEAAGKDPLTGAENYSSMMAKLSAQIADGIRHNRPLSYLTIDFDDFKLINSRYGHLAGDAALQHLVKILKRVMREVDEVCRQGGDEFSVIQPGTPEEGAEIAGKRALAAIKSEPVRYLGQEFYISVTIGGATFYPTDEDLTPSIPIQQRISSAQYKTEALRADADKALYYGKEREKGTYTSAREVADKTSVDEKR